MPSEVGALDPRGRGGGGAQAGPGRWAAMTSLWVRASDCARGARRSGLPECGGARSPGPAELG